MKLKRLSYRLLTVLLITTWLSSQAVASVMMFAQPASPETDCHLSQEMSAQQHQGSGTAMTESMSTTGCCDDMHECNYGHCAQVAVLPSGFSFYSFSPSAFSTEVYKTPVARITSFFRPPILG